MERTAYSIERRQDQWVVWADGARVLICQHKKMAIMTARRASDMLRESFAGESALAGLDDLQPGCSTPTGIGSAQEPDEMWDQD